MDTTGIACPRFEQWRVLPQLALSALLAMTVSASSQGRFTEQCALKDLAAVTLIENHGETGDVPSEKLVHATLMMLEARSACYQGRVSEAIALYEGILDLRPVAFVRDQRP
jgi:hypothetical protein